MCYSPIKIKNNSITYRPGIDKLFYTVPCGKCRECVSRKRDDWFVRLYYEWLKYGSPESQGQVIFITLSYNDFSKPLVSLSDTKFQSLASYYSDMISLLKDSSESRFLPRLNHLVEFYENTYKKQFPCSVLDFLPDFGEKIDRFDRIEFQKFIKSFRQYLHTNKIYSYDEQEIFPIKYFMTTEYGHESHRPHYHLLLFLPRKWNPELVKYWCEYCWSDKVLKRSYPDFIKEALLSLKNGVRYTGLFKNYDIPSTAKFDEFILSSPGHPGWNDWRIIYRYDIKRFEVLHKKGFCMYSKDNPPVIESPAGLEYVVKYLHKADDFLSDERFKRLKLWLEFFPASSTVKDTNRHLFDSLTELRDIFPFYRASNNFGDALFQELSSKSPDDLLKYMSKTKPITVMNMDRNFFVPQYIINRLLYNGVDVPQSDNTVRVLTDVGYQSVCQLFDVKLRNLAYSYAEQVKVSRSFMTESDLVKFFSSRGCKLDDVLSLVPDFKALAHYSLVWQNVAPKIDDNIYILWSAVDFFHKSRDLFFTQKSRSFDDSSPIRSFDFIALQHLSSRCFNHYPAFANYDKVLDAISYIRECVGMRDARHEFDDEKKSSQYRAALKMFKYQI